MFLLNKICHSAAVLSKPSQHQCSLFHQVILKFIRGHNSEGGDKHSIVSKDFVDTTKKDQGLGLHNTGDFWATLKIPWLSRLQKESTWRMIHLEYLNKTPLVFDPFTTIEESLKKACKTLLNLAWERYYPT